MKPTLGRIVHIKQYGDDWSAAMIVKVENHPITNNPCFYATAFNFLSLGWGDFNVTLNTQLHFNEDENITWRWPPRER